MGLTDKALLIHCFVKTSLTIWHVLSITTFCIRIYRAGQRLSSFQLLCNLLGIIPVVDSINGIMQVIFGCHKLISPSFKSVYFRSFSVMVQSLQPRERFEEDFIHLFTFPYVSNTCILITIFT
jgi:hypothetical protein